MNSRDAKWLIALIFLFFAGMLVGLSKEQAVKTKRTLLDTAEVTVNNTNLSKADWTCIQGTCFTIIKDESTSKYYLHADRGSLLELPKGYGK